MSAVPLSETAAKRRIGDILLAHGFVTTEQLADATAEQERTQQPLGQILVGHGAITRLELASALAEQWSDPAASISSTSRSSSTPVRMPSAQDEAQYAARLQEAVADLARKVQSNKPLEGIDERVEELSRRIEATLARTQHIEAAVATLAESLEGVTSGVEEAFYALQTGTADLVGDLARIEQTVNEIATREVPEGGGHSLAEIEELRAAVGELSDGGASATELMAQVDVLGTRVEHVAAQLVAVPSATNFEDLWAIVDELRARPAGTPDLDDRLHRLETDLNASASLRAELVGRIDALGERLTNETGPDARVDDVVAQLTRLEAQLDGRAADIEQMRATLALQDESVIQVRVDDLAHKLDVVQGQIAEVAASARPDENVGERLDAVTARVQMLADASGESHALAARLETLEARLAEGIVTPETLARTVEEFSPDHEPDKELAARLETLEARLAEGIVTPETLARTVEGAMIEQSAPVPDPHLMELSAEVTLLRTQLSSIAEIEARMVGLTNERTSDALATRLDELESARAGDLDTVDVLARAMDRMRHDITTSPPAAGDVPEVMDAVAQLAHRIAELEATPAEVMAPGPDESHLASEIERFRLVLERIGLHLGEHDRALADLAPTRGVQERLQELTALVQGLAQSAQDSGVAQAEGAGPAISGDIGTLLRRVEDAESASQSDSEKLMNRLERMASSIDWRLQRLESDETDDTE